MICPFCQSEMAYWDHGCCPVCRKNCGCSFAPTSSNDYCSFHDPWKKKPEYERIIAEDTETLKKMQQHPDDDRKWRTVIVGLPIIRKLLNGEDVELESFRINLIPDDVLFNAKPRPAPAASKPEAGHE